ncbi:amino acid ABC transporter substrate-binding protein [Pseudomonas sp. SDI]|uniref:substrate-binding periplasmic protein n=1 Tax=Pseudomonas sp. SDI TaxID=2170734 RepID=UPI000DE69F5B|nr:ABC transporter substrate-binding protein [Pseudomonas sp. SDI]PWB32074.1 amino acid ABC transporter substrate-binding protein [Pseudomonas sp. SDI]
MISRLLVVLFSALVLAGTARAAEPLVLLTENFPPYNMSADGKSFAREDNIQGIAAEIVREMFRRAQIPYSMTLRFPWERIYKQALETPGYGLFVTARQPDRETLFKWVGPIGPDDWILLARKDSKLTLDSLNDARGLKIGAYKGDAIAQHLSKQGLRPALVLRDQDNARKLVNGEIDLWATGDPAGRYLARQVGIGELRTVLRFHGAELFLALNKQVPDAVVKALQDALEQMRSDGFVDATFARYL